jgi:hypothetical protein
MGWGLVSTNSETLSTDTVQEFMACYYEEILAANSLVIETSSRQRGIDNDNFRTNPPDLLRKPIWGGQQLHEIRDATQNLHMTPRCDLISSGVCSLLFS